MKLHNRHDLLLLRRQLRNEPTLAERLLWRSLSRGRLFGYKFRRQHSIGRYILDFYCSDKRLCIELDGGIHSLDEISVYDQIRQKEIESVGIRVLRFSNRAVYHTLQVVLDEICRALLV